MLKSFEKTDLLCDVNKRLASVGSKKHYKDKNESDYQDTYKLLKLFIYEDILSSHTYDFKQVGLCQQEVFEKINLEK
jgi:hypothetical protein